MDTRGATAFKLPIMAKTMQSAVVSIKALRGSPFLETTAKGPKKGTTPSAAIACAQHMHTQVRLRSMSKFSTYLSTLRLGKFSTWSKRGEMMMHCMAWAMAAMLIPSSVRMATGKATSLTTSSMACSPLPTLPSR
jgi:hypothetical protein